MNILILSVGTRNKIVQYFKYNIQNKGKVIVTDMSELAPALYEADKYYIVPKMTDNGYFDTIYNICKKENISGVLSLIDPELSLLAKHKDDFEKIRTKVIGSSYELCEIALDKYEMYKWLIKNNFKCAKSYISYEEFYKDYAKGIITLPVFVKPYRGSASINISKVNSLDEIQVLMKKVDGLMIQEFLSGQEIGADVYIDAITGKVVSIFTKKKLKMRAGETDKAVSFKDEKLFKLIIEFVEKIGFKYQIDIDIFNVDGDYYISEVNPRFGGGYPHAYESGCNHIKMIINNINGTNNNVQIGNYENDIYMMKYNEVMVKKI